MTTSSESSPSNINGFEVVPFNLNKTAGGRYNYLYFSKRRDRGIAPVVDATVIAFNSAYSNSKFGNWHVVVSDLNAGANRVGMCIYLLYKTCNVPLGVTTHTMFPPSGTETKGEMGYVTGLEVVAANGKCDDPVAAGLLSQDLNEGSRGSYIYLGVKKGPRSMALTGFRFTSRSGIVPDLTDGWEVVPCDLNRGAGGNFNYLYFTRDKASGAPITELSLLATDKAVSTAPSGYELFEADLNQNARRTGKHIYCIYKRE
eukprot:GHVU01148039.1.p1 GENE.GHVU01148039.1~~GHVU01148039.1.p1  ORF type:complete len:258 (+),score=30.10 GHVU01148039.1:327-1100(+)